MSNQGSRLEGLQTHLSESIATAVNKSTDVINVLHRQCNVGGQSKRVSSKGWTGKRAEVTFPKGRVCAKGRT